MLIVFKCDQETKAVLDRLRSANLYPDYSTAIADGIKILDTVSQCVEREGHAILSGAVNAAELATDQSVRKASIPGLPSAKASGRKDAPVKDWIFGQYNRLLPLKYFCRQLALIQNDRVGVDLRVLGKAVSGRANAIRGELQRLDRANELPRGSRLSAGFPSSDPTDYRSQGRFASHFVGHFDKSGGLHGLPFAYGFLSAVSSKQRQVSLTVEGREFAALSNPVLDNHDGSAGALSDEEKVFLLKHIADLVGREWSAITTIIELLASGIVTPRALDESLEENAAGVSSTFVTTQRSGAISRMWDLGLIKRMRRGRHVEYSLTEKGQRISAISKKS